MKKYRLLKDLPTFGAGEIFRLEGGDLYYYPADNGTREAHWSDKIMAYYHKTLEKFPNILEEWFREVKEPKTYWYVDAWGDINERDHDNSCYIDDKKSIGNYFETKEEAELVVRKLQAWKRLKDKGFKFSDWTVPKDGVSRIEITANTCVDIAKDLDLLFGGKE